MNKIYFLVISLLLSFFTFSQDSTKARKVKHSLLPVVAITPETGLVGGLAWRLTWENEKDSLLQRQSNIDNLIYVSVKKQFVGRSKQDIYFKNQWHWQNRLGYEYFPVSYFGIGNRTLQSDEIILLHQDLEDNGKFEKGLTKRLFLGFNYDLRYDLFKEIPLDVFFPGQKGGFLYGIGPTFTYDSREHTAYPLKGFYYNLNSTFFPNLLNAYSFSSFKSDFRFFRSINPKNTFAFQWKCGVQNQGAPYYELHYLGDDEQLRGFHENRYRDHFMNYVQVEYRRKLFWRIGMTVFAGTGYVDPKINVMPAKLHSAMGIGGRLEIVRNSRVNIRGDITVNEDGDFKIYATIGEAF